MEDDYDGGDYLNEEDGEHDSTSNIMDGLEGDPELKR